MCDVPSKAEVVFRQESGLILAGLIRMSGSFDHAEEALQDAFASALVAWQSQGIPRNPGAWINTAARRKLIDRLRRERTWRDQSDALRYQTESTSLPSDCSSDTMNFPDDRLRLIFTCCHPALNRDAQVALTLRTLGGLSTPEIAKAFLIPEVTLAQRLVRAKRKIQEAAIPYEIPRPGQLQDRLAPVQEVLYLIFNEGYAARSGAALVREDLCAEALRLTRMLCGMLPAEAENIALLALMLLQHSRRDARSRDGLLITLEEQDRSLWDRAAIAEGLELLEQALRLGRAGSYTIQAAIAALHARAVRAVDTDWAQIAALYGRLYTLNPSPVIALNEAVAIAMSAGCPEGLARIEGLASELDGYYLFHAARADLLRRMNRCLESAQAYRLAIALATNPVEVAFLQHRLASLAGEGRFTG